MKKFTVMLTAVLMAGLLAACGQKFDATGYTKALLDNSYKNDSTAFVEMGIGTEEEAIESYEQTLDAEMESMLASIDLTEEQMEGYRDLFAQILAGTKYTVGEAEEQEDGSFIVTVSYEQMNVFVPTMTDYFTRLTEVTNEWMASGTVPTEEEMYAIILDYLKESFEIALENVTYDEPAETTIRIELVDDVYTPNEDDVMNLGMVLFDIEDMMNMEIE